MKKICLSALLVCLTLICLTGAALATDSLPPSPSPSPSPSPAGPLDVVSGLLDDMGAEDASNTVELIILLTVLTLAPSILILMTSFTRIVIVLSFTRNAMGTQQMPPNQVIIGLALFLTYFTMYGPINEAVETAWKPYANEEINAIEFMEAASVPFREFMLEQIDLHENNESLAQFMTMARILPPADPSLSAEIPTYVIIPAFITSELKTAFRMGFLIFLPFIVIDMVVASALMSMGMMMLPPVMISLPFKIMLFVLVDGWNQTVGFVVRSFG